jgi:hypothetical protein
LTFPRCRSLELGVCWRLASSADWRAPPVQLQTRPQGRRIVHPPLPARAVEVVLGHRQRPLSLRTLDRAMRAIAAHCKDAGIAPPQLQLALVGRARSSSDARAVLERSGWLYRSWALLVSEQTDVEYLNQCLD